jgi:hypothetical protein
MGFLDGGKRTKTRYLIEVPHDPGECAAAMREIVGRGPQYAQMFWWGCRVGEHSAWAWLDGQGREAVLEEALPPGLRERAIVRRLSRVDGREIREWQAAETDVAG